MLDSITVKIVTEHNLFNPMFTARFFLKTWSKCTIKRTREVISGTYSHVILNLGLRIVHFKKEVEKRKEGSGWMKLSEARSLKFKGEIEVEWETWLQGVNGNAGSIPFPQCWLLKFYYSVNTLKNKHTKININIFAQFEWYQTIPANKAVYLLKSQKWLQTKLPSHMQIHCFLLN